MAIKSDSPGDDVMDRGADKPESMLGKLMRKGNKRTGKRRGRKRGKARG